MVRRCQFPPSGRAVRAPALARRCEIAGLLKQAEALDRSEDAEQGSDGDDGGLPQELKRRADRLKVIQAAKARLEERQRTTLRQR
jgi:hypothetical protein